MPNKITREAKVLARAIVEKPEYLRGLEARIKAGKAPHMETLLWHYSFGKPKDTLELSALPVAVQINIPSLPVPPPLSAGYQADPEDRGIETSDV